MNVGLRLGPFRIGTNGRGRVTGGVTAGPLSFSGTLSGGSRPGAPCPVYPETLEEIVAYVARDGWKETHRTQWTVRVDRGWRARRIYQVREGTQIRPAVSSRAEWVMLLVGGALAMAVLVALIAAT